MKYYLKCKIIWQNYKISAFSEPSLIPKELLKDASGDFVFNQTAKTVSEIIKLISTNQLIWSVFNSVESNKLYSKWNDYGSIWKID